MSALAEIEGKEFEQGIEESHSGIGGEGKCDAAGEKRAGRSSRPYRGGQCRIRILHQRQALKKAGGRERHTRWMKRKRKRTTRASALLPNCCALHLVDPPSSGRVANPRKSRTMSTALISVSGLMSKPISRYLSLLPGDGFSKALQWILGPGRICKRSMAMNRRVAQLRPGPVQGQATGGNESSLPDHTERDTHDTAREFKRGIPAVRARLEKQSRGHAVRLATSQSVDA